MKIETGKYYKSRDGRKAYAGYERNGKIYGDIQCEQFWWYSYDGTWYKGITESPNDLVAPWNDETEEIDVSAMYIAVSRTKDKCLYSAAENIYPYGILKACSSAIAIVTVKDWQDIQQGKRKIIVGEGL